MSERAEVALRRKAIHRDDDRAVPELMSDDEVVDRVLAGDLHSFELIMRRYNQRLFRVARSIVGDDDEAEDVVQDAYVRAFEHLAQFAGRSTFSTWLTRIAVNEAKARRRKLRRITLIDPQEPEGPLTASPSSEHRVPESASMNELGRILAQAVDELPAELRVVFTMRVAEGLDTQETADCLHLTPSNVKVRLHRARSRLRQRIDDRIGKETRLLYQFGGERCNRIVFSVFERFSGV